MFSITSIIEVVAPTCIISPHPRPAGSTLGVQFARANAASLAFFARGGEEVYRKQT